VSGPEAPDQACYDLDEALTLLDDLEQAWETYVERDLLAGAVTMRAEVVLLHRKLELGGHDD
jgi:hypothetical protein